MIRNSILYRRLWYIRRRNAKRIHIFSKLIVIFVILVIITSFMEKKLLPSLINVSEIKTQEIITLAANKAIVAEYPNKIQYEDISSIERDQDGNIISVQLNEVKLNELSIRISSLIQSELYSLKGKYIKVPIGAISGNRILSSVGPNVRFSILPYGKVETKFRSEFTSEGENRTRHIIYLQVKACIEIEESFKRKIVELNTDIPVTEAIIEGKV